MGLDFDLAATLVEKEERVNEICHRQIQSEIHNSEPTLRKQVVKPYGCFVKF